MNSQSRREEYLSHNHILHLTKYDTGLLPQIEIYTIIRCHQSSQNENFTEFSAKATVSDDLSCQHLADTRDAYEKFQAEFQTKLGGKTKKKNPIKHPDILIL